LRSCASNLRSLLKIRSFFSTSFHIFYDLTCFYYPIESVVSLLDPFHVLYSLLITAIAVSLRRKLLYLFRLIHFTNLLIIYLSCRILPHSIAIKSHNKDHVLRIYLASCNVFFFNDSNARKLGSKTLSLRFIFDGFFLNKFS